MRLPAPLRLEAQQHHVALAVIDVQRRRFPFDRPARSGIRSPADSGLRIARQHLPLKSVLVSKAGPRSNITIGIRRQPGGQRDSSRPRCASSTGSRSRRTDPCRNARQRIRHRQLELIDGEHRRVVERDQRAAVVHEIAQLLDAFFADAAGVALRNGARPVAVDESAARSISGITITSYWSCRWPARMSAL